MKKYSLGFKQKVLVTMLTVIYANFVYANDVISESSSDKVIQLDRMVIVAEQNSVQDQLEEKLKKVAGATNSITKDSISQKKLSTNEDVFKLQSGIYAKSAGNEGVKVSIRGSGINRAPGAHASGLYSMLDGIPLTGPGGTPYELLEPWWLSGVEVYRGANGIDVNALALGGAINYLSQTGRDVQATKLRMEMGSHGYQKYGLSTGAALDQLDYYISLNHASYDGYQTHSAGESQGIMANVGYQITPDIQTRFYLRYRETEHQTPGRLTKAEIEHTPTKANVYNLQWDAKRIQPGSTWLANKTTFQLANDAELVASLAYHNYPMDLQESPYHTDVTYSDISASLAYIKPYQLFDKDSIAKLQFRTTTHRPDSGVTESLRFDLNGYEAGTITRKYTYRGSDNVLQLSNDFGLRPNLWLTTALSGIYTHRESEVFYPYTGEKLSEYEWNFAPRVGIDYQFNDDIKIFAHLSQSIEPAHPWSMIWGSNKYFPVGSGAATGRQRAPIHLDVQKSNSFELGGQGESRLGKWELSYYYVQVKDELLAVEISQNPSVIAESNASKTIHQGLEFGLLTPLYSSAIYGDLSFKQAYTYSDFHYKNDAIFADNQLAGVPKHYYQAQLNLKSKQGYYAAINAEYVSKIPVDYANSFYSKAYTLLGMSLGYEALSQKWSAWLDLRNLGNQHYAATVTPGYNDKGKDIARSTPGEDRAVYAGLQFNF